MTEQQYQTIWEQGQGEQPEREDGDRTTFWEEYGRPGVRIIKIERPVPDILAMKPGTTFTAKVNRDDETWRRFMRTGKDEVTLATGGIYMARAVDATTVRDVQEPPAMPEGDAS